MTITNTGVVDVELAPIAAPGKPFVADTASLPRIIPAHGAASFTVTFHPTMLQRSEATLRLGLAGRAQSQQVVTLVGTGAQPELGSSGCGVGGRRAAPPLVLAGLLVALVRRRQRRDQGW